MADGYRSALEAAGATVDLFETFGSYQGDWLARVTLANGQRGWISGSFGSCGGCDAFQSEMGTANEWCDKHAYLYQADAAEVRAECNACSGRQVEYFRALREFGRHYLEAMQTQAEIEQRARTEAGTVYAGDEEIRLLQFVLDNSLTPPPPQPPRRIQPQSYEMPDGTRALVVSDDGTVH